MSEPVPTETQAPNAPPLGEQDRERRRPSLRNRTIYERRVLGGETLAALATEYNVTHQRIAQIAARVEGWIAGHPEDQLANRLRLRCRLRYEALYESAVTGFADSRKQEVTVKQRTTTRAAKRRSSKVVLPSAEERSSAERKATEECPSAERKATEECPSEERGAADERSSAERKATLPDEDREDAKPEAVITVEERIVRQRHGDPRLLATAMKAVEKLERFAAALARGEECASPRGPAKPDGAETPEQRIQRRIAEETAWLAARDARVAAEKADAEDAAAEDAAAEDAAAEKANAEDADAEDADAENAAAEKAASSPATHLSPPATSSAGVGGQDSGVREETPQSNEADATASSLATLHTPLATPSLPTIPAALHSPPATHQPPPATRPKHVLIVAHYKQVDRMAALAHAKLPGFEITAACQAGVANEWIDKHVHEAAVIWLENDLGPRREVPGGTINPGTGREVAVRLAEARPRCRVLVNEGDDYNRPLCTPLDDAGCSVKEVFHEGGDWLRDNWVPALRRALRLPDEEGDFYFEDDDVDEWLDD